MITKVFRLTKDLTAVTSTNRGNNHVVVLPVGAMLSPTGNRSVAGLLEVTYEHQRYSVFEEDLLVRAESFRSTAAEE